jgi:glycosyltransferase involved in cell wall biosynthesis
MRVALLSHNAQAGDAIGNLVAEKLAFFLDHGADVGVLVESTQRLHPAVRPHCLKMPTPEPYGEAWEFLSGADLIVVEYGHYYRLLELLPVLAGGKGRILFDYHGVTPADLWPAHNREGVEAGARWRGLVWCADAAVAHSTFAGRELHEPTSFPLERIACLPHAVDGRRFRPGPPNQPLSRWLGVPSASLLLYVGRLAPNKRVPVLVEALHHLAQVTPTVHGVVIGADDDVYQEEARRCRELAARLGVADRLHLIGRVSDEQLLDAYRSADLLVIPSRHEGFCLPVIEAMACGLPVVAARAAALPETVADAGLSFTPDDPRDLARQVRRVLGGGKGGAPSAKRGAEVGGSALRVAVVAFRYGVDFVGGAETSLRTIAEVLKQAGHHVEVFTTCTRAESDWTNQLPEGTVSLGGLDVHRFRVDGHERERHLEAIRAVRETGGDVAPEVERQYLEHSIHSSRLLESLGARQDVFDAILVGPYLFGLTLDVARAFPDKTLFLPCFHDEPFARLRVWQEYERVGGILYHSPEEQAFAESQLGLNHPGAACIGALVDTENLGDPQGAGRWLPQGQPYLVYCGRFSTQKGVPRLIDYAQRYLALHRDRFLFAFLGQGDVPIPRHPGFRDLGFVTDDAKRDLLARAAALVQLSPYESLSYAALEAWAQGTPVIADQRCPVLAGHLARCDGGRGGDSFESFAQALDDLWNDPSGWKALGRKGQAYVKNHYGSRPEFSGKVVAAIRGLIVPLAERMRQRSLERAAALDRSQWRQRWADLVENLLDAPGRPNDVHVEVLLRSASRKVPVGSESVLVPVRVVNRGTRAILPTGPGRIALNSRVFDEGGQELSALFTQTDLPSLVMPGRAVAAVVPVAVPATPGVYRVCFQAAPAVAGTRRCPDPREPHVAGRFPESWLNLIVEPSGPDRSETCCAPQLDSAQAALAEAGRCQVLPADYIDVTEGVFASWKSRIKRKLLNNFKRAYVDVLSRQQSAFNRAVLKALGELAECCAALDHAAQQAAKWRCDPEAGDLAAHCRELKRRLAETEERLVRLETRVREGETGVPEVNYNR